MVRATLRTFFGDIRALRVRAWTSMVWGGFRFPGDSSALRGALPFWISFRIRVKKSGLNFLTRQAAVRLEDAGRCELAELVPDHVLGDVHRGENLAVVNAERVADEIGRDR